LLFVSSNTRCHLNADRAERQAATRPDVPADAAHHSDRCRDPLYLLQVGIKNTEPITAAIAASLSPLVAYLLQLPVGRLKVCSPFGGVFSPARHPERSTRQNLADTVYQVASRSEITSPSTHNRLICSTHVLRSGARTTRNNRRSVGSPAFG
jgi:hypothetical protein